MRGARTFRTELGQWGAGFLRCLAVLAVCLHVFVLQAHVHIPPATSGSGFVHAGPGVETHSGGLILASPVEHSPCILCQTLAANGAGLTPSAPMLAAACAAALVAALFGQRHVELQRLLVWRSRAPPQRL